MRNFRKELLKSSNKKIRDWFSKLTKNKKKPVYSRNKIRRIPIFNDSTKHLQNRLNIRDFKKLSNKTRKTLKSFPNIGLA